MALKYNIVIDQGTDFAVEFDVTNANNIPMDFTDNIITAKMRKHFESANSVSFTCSGSANGTIILLLTASATINMTPGRYMYDVMTEDSGGEISRIVEGIATLTPQITK